MATCAECKSFFRRSAYNPTNYCEKCLDGEEIYDVEDDLDIQKLLNPTGKTPARYSDD